MRRLARAFAVAWAVTVAEACLPTDTRPPPTDILITAEPSAAVTAGLTTSDGWTVAFEKLLIALGRESVDGDSCTSYAGAGYDRVFEMTVAGPQKLGEVFGLGSCTLQLRIMRAPSTEAILMSGVTPDDLAFMRTPGSDAYVPVGGVAVFVKGRATRAGVTKTFGWSFRQGVKLHDCPGTVDGGSAASALELAGGDSLGLRVVVHGEELLREAPSDSAAFAFDRLAGADADGDGEITLAELALVPAPVVDRDGGLDASDARPDVSAGDAAGFPDADAGDGAIGTTMADLVYTQLVPRLVHLGDGGACAGDLQSGGGRGGGPF